MTDRDFLEAAIALAVENVAVGGGPFAALVVRDGSVIARGVNRVTASADPTAHAEIVAIRAACAALGDFQLPGCILYSSCEPCPMCMGAIYWARPARVVYAATREEAAAAGFDDAHIYDELTRPPAARTLPMTHLDAVDAARPFDAWRATDEKTTY